MQGEFHLKVPPGRFSAAANLILNLDALKLGSPGEYSIELAIDGERIRTLPLNLIKAERPPNKPSG